MGLLESPAFSSMMLDENAHLVEGFRIASHV
jgi:hypothetical protein